MTGPRLLVVGVFNFSLAIFALLFGALQYLDSLIDFDPYDIGMYRDLAGSLGADSWVLTHRWVSIAGAVVAVLLLGAATGIVRTLLSDWGFTLDRTDRGFRRRRGLTTRTDVTIPAARVQAALLATGIVRRLLGWYELRLQSLAGDGAEGSDHLVAPLARLGEADVILAELGLDRAGLEDSGTAARTGWHRSHAVVIVAAPAVLLALAALLALVATLLPAALVARLDLPLPPASIALIPAAIALVALPLAWLDWRHRRWHFDGRVLHIAAGSLARRHIILPARNIQSIDLAIGPVGRRFALATLTLGVPGGKGGQHRIAAIGEAEARALRAALLDAR